MGKKIHGLPFKLRFKRSRIYVSAIPVWAIGFSMGFIGAIMGIGGGFILVPLLIYVLRVPTATVIGTSRKIQQSDFTSAGFTAVPAEISTQAGAKALVDGVLARFGLRVKCLSRIEKSQFLTDRDVTRRSGWMTIGH